MIATVELILPASVKAFYFLHRAYFGGLPEGGLVEGGPETDNSSEDVSDADDYSDID